MTLPWVISATVAGLAAGPPARACVARVTACPAPSLPLVAASSAVALAVLGVRATSVWELAALGWLAVLGVALAFVDAATRRLPDGLTAPAFAGTVALLAVAALAGHQPGNLLRALLGAAALAGFYLALVVLRPDGMGLGDVKLAASVGAALTWTGWLTLLGGTFIAFTLAASCGLALMAAGRASRTSHLPLGPFILVGALAAIAI